MCACVCVCVCVCVVHIYTHLYVYLHIHTPAFERHWYQVSPRDEALVLPPKTLRIAMWHDKALSAKVRERVRDGGAGRGGKEGETERERGREREYMDISTLGIHIYI